MANIVVFAFDLAEAAQRKRINSLCAQGHSLSTISFRRSNMQSHPLDVPNVDLGEMPNQRFLLRLWLLLRAIPRVVMAKAMLDEADVIIARNFDLLALAWIARRARVPLIYECLDIHTLMTGNRFHNRIIRRIERFLLRRSALLWTSSPGFLKHYFEDIQHYYGPSVVVENKLWFGEESIARPAYETRSTDKGAIVLGWVGSIRCQASFDILCDTARALPQSVRLEIHGNIHHHAIPDFDNRLEGLKNVSYFGPYTYPSDLGDVYGRCDLVWAQDLWQRGGNSDWLLPNRIYEASWFGCPSIAVAKTQTGQRVQALGLGLVIPTPTCDALVSCLRNLEPQDVHKMSKHILQMEEGTFRLNGAEIAAALAPVLKNDGLS